MVFGFAPGYVARTTIVGGTTSGYSLIGNRTIAIRPTMKMMIESTPAKIGRRMKKWEKFITFSWLFGQAFSGRSKLQIPRSKEAPIRKLQNDRCGAGMFEIWSLEFLWSL